MFEESYFENTWRWRLYRRWKRKPHRVAERAFYSAILGAPKGSVLLDLGANVGDITKVAVDLGQEVIAFEPDWIALATLRERFGNHPLVTIIPKAVGGSSRVDRFYQRSDKATQWSSLVRHDVHDGGQDCDVDVVGIIDFIQDLGRPIAAIKMDIEGAEAECLEALLDAGIAQSLGTILVETHERFSPALALRLEAIRRRIEAEGIKNIDLNWS